MFWGFKVGFVGRLWVLDLAFGVKGVGVDKALECAELSKDRGNNSWEGFIQMKGTESRCPETPTSQSGRWQ